LHYAYPDNEGIKRRQLFEDIRFMESEKGWSIPLERLKDGKKTYYRYSDPEFSINNSPLTETEAEQLRSALLILSRFKGAPQFEWVEEIIPKMEQTFGLRNQAGEIISFDENRYLKGIDLLAPLFEAILNKKPLRITYQSFKNEKPNLSVIHPYYLKQYNNRWYLLGQTTKFSTLSVRALDRIEKIEEVDEPFIENTRYDFSEYFEDIIGINRGKGNQPEKITLWFAPGKAPYIQTKPIHGSQKVKKNDEDGLVITIEVIVNYELKSLLLSFCNEVKVLSPESLDRQLKEMAYQ
jgi:predicted DNA-binding transcriptional regulator YafY